MSRSFNGPLTVMMTILLLCMSTFILQLPENAAGEAESWSDHFTGESLNMRWLQVGEGVAGLDAKSNYFAKSYDEDYSSLWHGCILRSQLPSSSDFDILVTLNNLGEEVQVGRTEVRLLNAEESLVYSFSWTDKSSVSNKASINLREGSSGTEIFTTGDSYDYTIFLEKDLRIVRTGTSLDFFIEEASVHSGTALSDNVAFLELAVLKYQDICPSDMFYDYVSVTCEPVPGANVPDPPYNLNSLVVETDISLTWNSPDNDGGAPIVGYKIYRGVEPGLEAYLTTVGDVLTYLDVGLMGGRTYYYRVSALNVMGESPPSNEADAALESPISLPGPPMDLEAQPGDGQAVLTWNPPLSDGNSPLTEYRIYRAKTAGVETSLETIGNVLSFTDTLLTNGQTYHYKVTAINALGEGPFSNGANTVPFTPSVPSVPLDIQSEPGNGRVHLSWSEPLDDGGFQVSGYNIMRGTDPLDLSLLTSVGSITEYEDIGLINGVSYHYRVGAQNEIGQGPLSNLTSSTPATVPLTPRSLQAIPGDTEVHLSWEEPESDGGSSILNYSIYRKRGSQPEKLAKVLGSVSSWTDTGLENGKEHSYRISAANAVGEGPVSDSVGATPFEFTTPSPPRNLKATAGNGWVILEWDPPSTDGGAPLSGYNIYRGLTTNQEIYLTSVGMVGTYNDSGLAGGKQHFYKVTALNSKGEGSISQEVDATPSLVPTPPSAPVNLQAFSTNTTIELSWSPPLSSGGSPVLGYRVYRGTSSDSLSVLGSQVTASEFTDTDVNNGTTYFYQISAQNALGEGPLSQITSAKVGAGQSVPSEPRDPGAVSGDTQVHLSWQVPLSNGNSPISGYRVYRGAASGSLTLLTTISDGLELTDKNLTNGEAYYYAVSAENGVGEGPRSDEVKVTPAAQTAPSQPTGLLAEAGFASVKLYWNSPSNDGGAAITNYMVHRKEGLQGQWSTRTLGAVLSFTDTAVQIGVEYFYSVSASNGVGEGARSDEVSAVPMAPPEPPGRPRDILATPEDGRVTLSWSPPLDTGGPKVTKYRVYRSTDILTPKLLKTLGNVTNYMDSGLTNDVTYHYWISAETSVGEGPRSWPVNGTPFIPDKPGPPQSLSAIPGDGTVTLEWSSPTDDGGSVIANYRVYRGTTPASTALLVTVGNVYRYTDSTTTNFVTYYYKVSAQNVMGEGQLSEQVQSMPQPTPSVPGKPRSLVCTAGNGFNTVEWSTPDYDGGKDLVSFNIYRGEHSHFEDQALIGTVEYTDLNYTDEDVNVGTLYYYRVTARNELGEGPPSHEAWGIPFNLTIPSEPQNLQVEARNGSVLLSWSPPQSNGGTSIINYRVLRGNTSDDLGTLDIIGPAHSFTDTTIEGDHIYYYAIAAMNDLGEGPRSPTVNVTTPSDGGKDNPNGLNDNTPIDEQDVNTDTSWELMETVVLTLVFLVVAGVASYLFLRQDPNKVDPGEDHSGVKQRFQGEKKDTDDADAQDVKEEKKAKKGHSVSKEGPTKRPKATKKTGS